MKLFIIFTILISSITINAQESKIVKLLNEKMKQELPENPDKIKIIHPFEIKNGILSFEFERENHYKEEIYYIKREVALKNIEGFIKDINVIFLVRPNSITETTIKKLNDNTKTTEVKVLESDLFFTELNQMYSDEGFRNDMLKAFKKININLNSEYWYD